jgi:hypothetical protein
MGNLAILGGGSLLDREKVNSTEESMFKSRFVCALSTT